MDVELSETIPRKIFLIGLYNIERVVMKFLLLLVYKTKVEESNVVPIRKN